MRFHQPIVASILVMFCSMSVAVAASYDELGEFVQEEAYIIANNLKLNDIVKEKTVVEVTAHRVDAHGIHWLSGDVKIISTKYGLCAVALQLKFVLENEEILIVSSKGVLAALEIEKGVESYQRKLLEYKNNVEAGGHALMLEPE